MASAVSDARVEAVVKPAFLQLLPSELTSVAECAIECQNSNGTTIRIHIKGPQLPDLTALTASLQEGER